MSNDFFRLGTLCFRLLTLGTFLHLAQTHFLTDPSAGMSLTLAHLPGEILSIVTSHLDAFCLLVTLPLCGDTTLSGRLKTSVTRLDYKLHKISRHFINEIAGFRGLLELSVRPLVRSFLPAESLVTLLHTIPSTLVSLSLDHCDLENVIYFRSTYRIDSPLPLTDPGNDVLNLRKLFPRLSSLTLSGEGFRQCYMSLPVAVRLRFISSLPRSLTFLSMPEICAIPVSPWGLLPPCLTSIYGDPSLLPTADLPQSLAESLLELEISGSMQSQDNESMREDRLGGQVTFLAHEDDTERRYFPPCHDCLKLVFPPRLTRLGLQIGRIVDFKTFPTLPPTLTDLAWSGMESDPFHPLRILQALPASVTRLSLRRWSFGHHEFLGSQPPEDEEVPPAPDVPRLEPLTNLQSLSFTFSARFHSPVLEAQLYKDLLDVIPNITDLELCNYYSKIGIEPKYCPHLRKLATHLAPICFEPHAQSGVSNLCTWTPRLSHLTVFGHAATASISFAALPTSLTVLDTSIQINIHELSLLPKSLTTLISGRMCIDAGVKNPNAISRFFYNPRELEKTECCGTADYKQPLSLTILGTAEFKRDAASGVVWLDCATGVNSKARLTANAESMFRMPSSLTYLHLSDILRRRVDVDNIRLPNLATLKLDFELPLTWPFGTMTALKTMIVSNVSTSSMNSTFHSHFNFGTPPPSKPFSWPPNLTTLRSSRLLLLASNILPLPLTLREIGCPGSFSPFSALTPLPELEKLEYGSSFMQAQSKDMSESLDELPPSITELSVAFCPPQAFFFPHLLEHIPRLRKLNVHLESGQDEYLLGICDLVQLGVDVSGTLGDITFTDPASVLEHSIKHLGDGELLPGESIELFFERLLEKALPSWKYATKLHQCRFSLSDTSWSRFAAYLSPTLTELLIENIAMPSNFAQFLPRTLTSLIVYRIQSPQRLCTAGLPDTLQKLLLPTEEFDDDTYAAIPRNVRMLALCSSPGIEPSHVLLLPPRLVTLSLDATEISVESIAVLPPSLKSLRLTGTSLSPQHVAAAPPGIKRISTRMIPGTEHILEQLAIDRQMEHLGSSWRCSGRLKLEPIETLLDALLTDQL